MADHDRARGEREQSRGGESAEDHLDGAGIPVRIQVVPADRGHGIGVAGGACDEPEEHPAGDVLLVLSQRGVGLLSGGRQRGLDAASLLVVGEREPAFCMGIPCPGERTGQPWERAGVTRSIFEETVDESLVNV